MEEKESELIERTPVFTEKKKNNRVKLYGVFWGIGLLIFQHSMYLLANVIAGAIGIPAISPKTAIDDFIPLVPIFILPYVWSYVFGRWRRWRFPNAKSGIFTISSRLTFRRVCSEC